MMTVTTKVQFTTGRAGRKRMHTIEAAAPPPPTGRAPRVARLMALAIRFDGLLQDGAVSDLSELARLAHVTQPRMTQIMNLNHLAPDIQEQVLHLPLVGGGRDVVTERALRAVCGQITWDCQRVTWNRLRQASAPQ